MSQLDLLPALEALPTPHRYQPLDVVSGLGPCADCGALRLDEIHTHTGSLGVARLFDELDRVPRDRIGRARDTLHARIADLTALAGAEAHATDESFKAGVAWGIAALRLALRAVDGETRPTALQLPSLTRR